MSRIYNFSDDQRQAIAATVRKVPRFHRIRLANALVELFFNDDRNFSPKRFREACGIRQVKNPPRY